MEACRKGRFDEAEAKLHAALRLVQACGGGCTAAKIHSNLGIVYELQGHREKAEHHYQNALELMKAKTAVSHPLRIRLAQGLARVSLAGAAPAR